MCGLNATSAGLRTASGTRLETKQEVDYELFHLTTFPQHHSLLSARKLTGLNVAVISDDSAPACVDGEAAGVSLSLTFSLQQFLLFPHLFPVPQEKYSVLQHKVPESREVQEKNIMFNTFNFQYKMELCYL